MVQRTRSRGHAICTSLRDLIIAAALTITSASQVLALKKKPRHDTRHIDSRSAPIPSHPPLTLSLSLSLVMSRRTTAGGWRKNVRGHAFIDFETIYFRHGGMAGDA